MRANRWKTFGDPALVLADQDRVLDIALRQPPDRRRPETEQRLAFVGRVPLKVAAELVGFACNRQRIAGQCKMIESDADITRPDQRAGNRFGLRVPFDAARKRRLLDLALVQFEARHVRIAEHSEAVGLEQHGLANGLEAGTDVLMGKPVDQVEIDRRHTRRPQAVRRGLGLFEALDAVDRLLDDRVEALHAQASAGHTAGGERADHFRRQGPRIDLDRHFAIRTDVEGAVQRGHQLDELTRLHQGRRASAEMNVPRLWPVTNHPRHERDFAMQGIEIAGDRLVTGRDRRVAAAIPAHRPAERYVEIEGHRLARSGSWCSAAAADRRSAPAGQVARLHSLTGADKCQIGPAFSPQVFH